MELGVDFGVEVERLRGKKHRMDGEIDVAGFEAVAEAPGCWDDGNVDRRSLVGEALKQRGEDQGVEEIRGDEAEGPGRGCGIEGLWVLACARGGAGRFVAERRALQLGA